MSCIASNDFIDWCKSQSIDLISAKLYDSQYPRSAYDYTLDEIQLKYSRKFYSYPIINIDGLLLTDIKRAKAIIQGEIDGN